MVTTTDRIGDKPYRCDRCRALTGILVPRPENRRVCIDCLPERERAVFRGK